MKLAVILSVILVVINVATSNPLRRIKRWEERPTDIVESPNNPNHELFIQALASRDETARYTDYSAKLTVVKDADLNACFITDLDPNFWPFSYQRQQIAREMVSEVILTLEDYVAFSRRAGSAIASFCQRSHIYWVKPEDIPQGVPNDVLMQPVAGPEPNRPNVQTGVNAPPPVSVYRAEHPIVAPPPLPQSQTIAPPPVTQKLAPPPVDLYLQQQEQHAAAATQAPMTPPPLSAWRSMQNQEVAAPPPLLP